MMNLVVTSKLWSTSQKCSCHRSMQGNAKEIPESAKTGRLIGTLDLMAVSIQTATFPNRKAEELKAEKKLQQEEKKHPA